MFLCRTTLKDNNLNAKWNFLMTILTCSYEFLLHRQCCRSSQVYMTLPKLYKVKEIAYCETWGFNTDLTVAILGSIVIHSSHFHCFAVAYCLLGVSHYAALLSEWVSVTIESEPSTKPADFDPIFPDLCNFPPRRSFPQSILQKGCSVTSSGPAWLNTLF